jgi:hypothetical protein
VPEGVFFPIIALLLPEDEIELSWQVLLNHQTISSADIGPLQAQINGLFTNLEDLRPPVVAATSLPEILAKFQYQAETIRVPLYILIAEVMLLGLYYVTMVAALSVRQAEREFAVLRSRGASGWQLFRIQASETLIILAAAGLGGPILGAGFVKSLSLAGPLADLELAHRGLTISQGAWQAAGIGVLACLAGLLLPIYPALRTSIVTHQKTAARSASPPWWQRLYLDVFVLVGSLILIWRLRIYEEVPAGIPGAARLDWLLLLAPVALLLGSATVLLRVFPLALRAMASLVARGRGLVGALALWQAARNPTHAARLVLLLALAIALGNLSTGLNATLDQSEQDRAHYLAGNDLRVSSQGSIPLVALSGVPGVLQLSGAWRGQGEVEIEAAPAATSFEILAIEPDSFAQVTTYREDFSDQDLDEILGTLSILEGKHPSLLQLPGEPAAFGLWLWGQPENKAELDSYHRWIDGDEDAARVGVMAKLQTAQGELFTINLQRQDSGEGRALLIDQFTIQMEVGGRDLGLRVLIQPDTQGWHYFEGSLPVLPANSYPLSLHSLWFQNQATRLGEPIAKSMAVVMDDLTVVAAQTREPQIVEDFDGLGRTLFLNVMEGESIYIGLTTFLTGRVSHSGESGQFINMRFTQPGQAYPLRLRQVWARDPLPALASPAFMAITELKTGDLVRARINRQSQGDQAITDFRIMGTLHHFPTLYEHLEGGFLVTSRDLLLALFNETSQEATNPNEVFVESGGRATLDSLSPMVPALNKSWSAESVRLALKANPLALGLRGVTFFGSTLTLLLSFVGFATHFYLSVREREALHGVMRALGISPRQLYGSIVLEQAILILAGIILGAGLGVLLNQITLPRLPVSLADQPPIPPFLPQADWAALAWLCFLFVVASIIVTGIVTVLLWRARIDRVLRIGQE